MNYAVDTEGKSYLPDGHFDKSVDPFGRPSRWSEGEGHFAIEIAATPEGVVGKANSRRRPQKAKRPMAAILKYLTLWHDDVLAAFPRRQRAARGGSHPAHRRGHGALPARAAEQGLEAGLRAAAHRAGDGSLDTHLQDTKLPRSHRENRFLCASSCLGVFVVNGLVQISNVVCWQACEET